MKAAKATSLTSSRQKSRHKIIPTSTPVVGVRSLRSREILIELPHADFYVNLFKQLTCIRPTKVLNRNGIERLAVESDSTSLLATKCYDE